jgi:hypothetical protein
MKNKWSKKIKKTCEGCRASEFHNECSLGYACREYTPLEPCPKPRTIRQLIDAPKSKV